MIPVNDCPGVKPQPDGTCAACGNRVAEYFRAAIGRRRFEHKRGTVPGTETAVVAARKGQQTRVVRKQATAARVVELEAALDLEKGFQERDVMKMLARIEAKLDRLIARPAGYVESHRRKADGGRSVREQRIEVGLPKRPRRERKRHDEEERSASAIRQADWRRQRQERPKPVPA